MGAWAWGVGPGGGGGGAGARHARCGRGVWVHDGARRRVRQAARVRRVGRPSRVAPASCEKGRQSRRSLRGGRLRTPLSGEGRLRSAAGE